MALAFGVVGAVGSVASIGMQLSSPGIGFSAIKDKVGGFLHKMVSKSHMHSRKAGAGRYALLGAVELSL